MQQVIVVLLFWPEEGIGLGHLVIHVHENRGVKRRAGQPRIVRLTAGELNVGQLEALRPPRELDEVVLDGRLARSPVHVGR